MIDYCPMNKTQSWIPLPTPNLYEHEQPCSSISERKTYFKSLFNEINVYNNNYCYTFNQISFLNN